MKKSIKLVLLSLTVLSVMPVIGSQSPAIAQTDGKSTDSNTSRVTEADLEKAFRKAEADRLLDQGSDEFDRSQFRAALESWQAALKIYREINDRRSEGLVLGNLGIVYDILGDYPKAIEFQKRRLLITREMRDRQGEGETLTNLGLIYKDVGDYPQALKSLEESLVIKREVNDHQGEGNSFGSLGLVYGLLGKYPKAIESHQQHLAIARKFNDARGEGQALGNLGLIYYELGDYSKAIEYYDKDLAIVLKINDRLGESNVMGLLGSAYWGLGDTPQAIEYHQKSLAIARQINDRAGERNALGNLGVIYMAIGDYTQAFEFQSQVLSINQELNDRRGIGVTLINLGSMLNQMGDYENAIKLHVEAISVVRGINDRRGEGKALNNLGEALFRLNKLKEAETELMSAIAVQESLRADLPDRNKISIAEIQSNPYTNLQQVLIAQNRLEAALEIAERGRGRAFAELLAARLRNKTVREIPENLQSPNLDEIRRIAKTQNATLVEYALHDEFIYIWVVKPDGKIVFKAVNVQDATTTINKLVIQSRSAFGVRSRGMLPMPQDQLQDPTKNLQALHQLLIAPIATELPTNPNERVIFIPQGSLFLTPFPALQDVQGKYLIEKHTISTAPSIQTLALTETQSRSTIQSNQAVIVGNPTMPILSEQQLAPLPGSEKEAIAIGQILNTKPLIGVQANKAAVLNQAQNASIIHLATHGLLGTIQGDVPGAIALAPTATDNGVLSANELFDLKLRANLVVLSACDTGRGEITGDGVIGLSRSIIAAGVPSVVVSLWAINDQSTSVLMSEFYRTLKTNPNKAKALRQAMLATMKQYPQPIYWAAFTLVGED